MTIDAALTERAGARCELCEADTDLAPFAVSPSDGSVERSVLTCGLCRGQLLGDLPLDPKHWFCLQQAIWSEVGAVQVVSWRVLNRLLSETWARDLLDQAYLDEETLRWAQEGDEAEAEGITVVDSHGTPLADGDTVTVIKDLDVKGTSFTAKRGTVVKNIRLTDDPELVEGRVNRVGIFLKTVFLKKVG